MTTGANPVASRRRASSSAASVSRRLVIPKAQTAACRSSISASISKSSSSFGLEPGKPASMKWMPSSSSLRTTRAFSCAESDMPWPCMPSRKVVS